MRNLRITTLQLGIYTKEYNHHDQRESITQFGQHLRGYKLLIKLLDRNYKLKHKNFSTNCVNNSTNASSQKEILRAQTHALCLSKSEACFLVDKQCIEASSHNCFLISSSMRFLIFYFLIYFMGWILRRKKTERNFPFSHCKPLCKRN
jgi:hypothetical protein